jgi:hypothetical protein
MRRWSWDLFRQLSAAVTERACYPERACHPERSEGSGHGSGTPASGIGIDGGPVDFKLP